MHDVHYLDDIQPLSPTHAVVVNLPNGNTVTATHSGSLRFTQLPLSARHAYIFPHLENSLLSIGILCDHGYTATYDKDKVNILNCDNNIILSGTRHPFNKLWMIPMSKPQSSIASLTADHTVFNNMDSNNDAVINNATQFDTIAKKVEFYHAAYGSPTPSTFINAVSKGFIHLPNITVAQVRKYTPHTFPTMAGHLDQQRQHPHQSHAHHQSHPPDHDDCSEPALPLDSTTQREGSLLVTPISNRAFMDLTGRFPVQSKSGYNYILIVITDHHNYIHLEPMKNRTAPEYVRALTKTLTFFKLHGVTFTTLHMDNETSAELEAACTTENIHVQYFPPNVHRANRAERAIRTFKNHFIAILAGAHPDFPLSLWDSVLEQVELTLNLLRPSHQTSSISAYQSLRGLFDFVNHAFAPIGTQVAIHNKSAVRASWDQHALRGYYLGPALKHYRSHRVYVTTLRSERVSDTLDWFPHDSTIVEPPPHLQPLHQQLQHLSDVIHQQLHSTHFSSEEAEELPFQIGLLSERLSSLLYAVTNTNVTPPLEKQRVSPDTSPVENQRVSSPPMVENQRVSCPPTHLSHAPSQFIVPAVSTACAATPLTPPGLTLPIPKLVDDDIDDAEHYSASLSLDPDAIVQPASYREAMNGPEREHWEKASAEEFIRLVETYKAMKFVAASEKPVNVKATYYNPQVQKKRRNGVIIYRVRGTVGGNLIEILGIKSSYTASLATVKLHLNSVVSEDAEYITADVKDYYLGSEMSEVFFMWVSRKQIPADIIARYNLEPLFVDDMILVKIVKGMYGLPHAGKLAQDKLLPHLAKHGYHQCPNTRCLFKHESRPISFTLVVDDFGIKFKGKEHAEHLLNAIKELYEITVDWTGSKYLGIVIDYNREKREMRLSMPKYVENAIERFGAQSFPNANSPLVYVPPSHHRSRVTSTDSTPLLPPDRKLRIQQIVGTFLYYARAVDPTMLTAISKLSSLQAEPTEAVEQAANRFLSYAKTWPNASLLIRPSDMILYAHSDASYLSETKARSRIGGVMYLGKKDDPSFTNAAVEQLSAIIDVKVSSAAEAEYAGLYHVSRECEPLRETLAELGYPQPPTLITCDNQLAVALSYDQVKQKRSKAMDMRFHWIRDRIRQNHFKVEWKPGITNLADFFTKAHSCKHHLAMRSQYVVDPPLPSQINNAKRRYATYQRLRQLISSLGT